jgi:hypothetical protein
LTPEQRRGDGRHQIDAAQLVGKRIGNEARLSVDLSDQSGKAALALDDIVERRTFALCSIPPISRGIGVDDPGIARARGVATNSEPFGGSAHAVHKNIGRLD